MIKYLGSKRLLIPYIVSAIRAVPKVHKVLDLFSGTARVGHALKKNGFYVEANDHLTYAYNLAQCYVEADAKLHLSEANRIIHSLSKVKPRAGYFTETFCYKSKFFHPKNGAKIDAIRDKIDSYDLKPIIKAIALTSLMEAADRVDSTTGIQMAYLKKLAPRAYNDLEMRVPEILEGPGRAFQLDAFEMAQQFNGDVAYLDPPYNQHKYMNNYHIWETLVRWDKPEYYGVACKRNDCREYKSLFNSKHTIRKALQRTLSVLRCPFVIVSFNDEGYISKQEMEAILSDFGHVTSLAIDFKRYVGAQIGIFNQKGEKVGKVNRLYNKEILYFAGKDKRVVLNMLKATENVYQPNESMRVYSGKNNVG